MRLLSSACIAAALALAACIPGGGSVRTVAVTGTVYTLDGEPAEGVTVSDEAETGSAVTGPDGRFAFTIDRRSSGVVLPVSGVYRAPVDIKAQSPALSGRSGAVALSTSEEAMDTILIALPAEEVAAAQALLTRRSPACGSDPARGYAHAMLDRLDALTGADWLEPLKLTYATEGQHERLKQLVLAARVDCELSEENWRGDVDALDAAFLPD
ncbi:MAG: hypothetical protein ABL308_08465 [Oceanicaulis sp.]